MQELQSASTYTRNLRPLLKKEPETGGVFLTRVKSMSSLWLFESLNDYDLRFLDALRHPDRITLQTLQETAGFVEKNVVETLNAV